jgi:hypothetical protein
VAASSLLRRLAGLLGGVLAAGGARGVTLPEDSAEAMIHVYHAAGLTASGPAVLVRKSVADKVSLSASYYVDAVSSASVDVVTTASPYSETRHELNLGAEHVVRDGKLRLAVSTSREPDYVADSAGFDVDQEVFGGMTTVTLGFTRGADKVGQKGVGFFDTAHHWQYRLGATQILSTRWLASANLEAISDDGYLGSPYRAARVFGATVPERVPRTRTSRALKLRAVGALDAYGARDALRVEYRYYWDTWDIKAHTAEVGYARRFGDAWSAEGFVRLYTQSAALFYSDNAAAETTYVSRNRQLGSFDSAGVGTKVAYTVKKVPGRYELKANGSYELVHARWGDFTDLRTGRAYSQTAHVLQVNLAATF